MEKRRFTAIIMAVLMVITLVPSMVFASAPSGTLGGKLKIKGHAVVGNELRADYGKAEPQGLSDDYVSFAWYRELSDTDSEKVGKEKKYTVTDEDLGYKIRLEITGREDMGVSGTLTAKTLETAATEEEAQMLADQKEAEGAEVDTISTAEEAQAETQDPEEMQVNLYEETPEAGYADEMQQEQPTEVYEEQTPEESDPPQESGNSDLDVTISEEWNQEEENAPEAAEEAPVYTAEAVIEDADGTVNFGNVEAGGEADAAKYVTIRNTGNRTLHFEGISPEHFMVKDIEEPLEPNGETSVWIQPREGLEAGEYLDTITYVTEENAEVSIPVQMTYGAETHEEQPSAEEPEAEPEPTEEPTEQPEEAPAEYAVSADLDAVIFGSLKEGYGEITDFQSVTITNSGESAVTLKMPEAEYFDVFIMADGEENPRPYLEKGQSVGFMIQPKLGLLKGSYSESIVFGIEENADVTKTVTAEAVVEAAQESVVSVKADPSEIAFSDVKEGYTDAETETVTLTNDGNTDVTLEQPLAENFDIGALSGTELAAGESVSFTVQPQIGLPEGYYSETIQVSGKAVNETEDGGEWKALTTVDVSVNVEKKAVSKLKVSPDYLDFGEREMGYEEAPKSQKVTVTNKGNTRVVIEKPQADNFRIGNLSREVLEPGDSCTFAVRPKNALEESTYIETIMIPNDAGVEAQTEAEFTVTVKSNGLLEIQNPAEIKELKNGVEKTAKALGLPSTVIIKTSEGKMKAKVKWNVDDCAYDPAVKEAQNFKVKGKVVLPDDVKNPNDISLTTTVKVSVKAAYTPKVPNASENYIDGIASNGYTTQSKISFTAVGAGMKNTSPREGDVRFLPVKWRVINTNSWSDAPYSATFGITKPGIYTLKVMFERQKFDGKNWVSTGEQDTKQVQFSIAQGTEITPTPTAQQKKADKRSAVETGDTTAILPFIIILVVAVFCIAGIVVYKKKRK